MAEEISPEIISSTQKLLGRYVTKPPLTEKLLKKPPFRFLHDVVHAVIKETGFLKGLFTESELNSENVKDRDSKAAFLNKLITAVKTISGTDLKVRSSKVIAGLEPEETNKLLQTIATCINKKLDSKEYVSQLKGTSKKDSKESVKKVPSRSSLKSDKSLDSTRKKEPSKSKETGTVKKQVSPKVPSTKTNKTSKNEKTIPKTTNTKANDVTPRNKEPSKTKVSPKSDLNAEKVEVENDKETIENLPEGPKIGNEEVEETIENDNKEPNDKPVATKQNETKDNQEAKENIQTNEKSKNIEETALQELNSLVNPPKPHLERPKSARPRSGDYPKAKDLPKPAKVEPMKATYKPTLLNDDANKTQEETKNKIESHKMDERPPTRPPSSAMRPKSSLLRPPSVRPSSARPGAPRLRADSAIPMKEIIPLGKINVIVENYDQDNALKRDDEEETVVIQNEAQEEVMAADTAFLEKSLDIPADKGHLVEQILEQIQGPEVLEEQIKSNLEWESSRSGKDATIREINALRTSIQALTKTANPLGKLMSYLHEDVEAMHSELESWTKMCKQYSLEIGKQKQINNEKNAPLLRQLKELEENIKREREEIDSVKNNIIRNEEKIKDLVLKQITMQ